MTLEKTQSFNNSPIKKITLNNLSLRIIGAAIGLFTMIFVLEKYRLTGAVTLIVIMSGLIAFEISNLFFDKDSLFKIGSSVIICVSLWLSLNTISTSYAELLVWIGLMLIPWIYRLHPMTTLFDKFSIYLLILVYCFFLPLKVFEILLLDEKFYYFYFFTILIFGIDTFAYLFGKLFGRRFFKNMFQPQISPTKTIEGFLGSLLWPAVLILICQNFFNFQFTYLSYALIYLTCFAAISGDLLASLIKRKSLKKDSGQLFIGHGGFLDRLDSLLVAAPVFLMASNEISLLL